MLLPLFFVRKDYIAVLDGALDCGIGKITGSEA
jgi:hypothetical protein